MSGIRSGCSSEGVVTSRLATPWMWWQQLEFEIWLCHIHISEHHSTVILILNSNLHSLSLPQALDLRQPLRRLNHRVAIRRARSRHIAAVTERREDRSVMVCTCIPAQRLLFVIVYRCPCCVLFFLHPRVVKWHEKTLLIFRSCPWLHRLGL